MIMEACKNHCPFCAPYGTRAITIQVRKDKIKTVFNNILESCAFSQLARKTIHKMKTAGTENNKEKKNTIPAVSTILSFTILPR